MRYQCGRQGLLLISVLLLFLNCRVDAVARPQPLWAPRQVGDSDLGSACGPGAEDTACSDRNTCQNTKEDLSACSDEDARESDCICLPPSATLCRSDKSCGSGACFDVPYDAGTLEVCLETVVADELRLRRSGVCVDARALYHLEGALVFPEHVMARVLCDAHGSCATPGHLVYYQGRAMMMKTYCAALGNCVGEVMKVNSPKYSRGLRVESRTPGLSYTPFAARYESVMEEAALATLVRLGL